MHAEPLHSETAQTNMAPVSVNRVQVKSPSRLALQRFMNNKLAVVSVFVVLFIVIVSLAAPLLTHINPSLQDLSNTDAPPSAKHLLGTDSQGMDYFARDLYGGRIDLLIGVVDAGIILTIGIILGGLAGYYGKWVDSMIMRVVDFMMNFPGLLLIIVLTSIIPKTTIWMLILVIAFTGWAGMTRFVRGLFLNLRDADYVLAAKISGAGVWRIIFRHMLPNSMGPLVVQATFLIAGMIGVEAALAIIGFGVPTTTPSWGNVLNGAQDYFVLKTQPWAWIPPAGLIFLTILCINFIGDGLRDAFDPSFEQ